MTVRTEVRRGQRVLIVDIRYRRPDGTKGRYRHDAEVQTLAAARAEDRRRLAALTLTGSPAGRIDGDGHGPISRRPSRASSHRNQRDRGNMLKSG
jgi:hypothetical protein